MTRTPLPGPEAPDKDRPMAVLAPRGGTGRHPGAALAVICTAQLMVILDASIVNVALPSVQRALHFSVANLVWVINGYTLAFGGLLLLGGRTGDLFGRRRMFIAGVLVFTVASLLGGLATTSAWLLSARIVQGMGAAVASPTALALIATTFAEGPARNRAMGVYAAMSGAGGAIGVLLGGVLTSSLSWRWVLFVNVPLGLGVALVAWRVLEETKSRGGALDLPGAASATGGMTLLVFGLIHAATTSWTDTWTTLSLAGGAMFLTVFVFIEDRSQHPLLPLSLLRDRNRSTANAVLLTVGAAVFAMFYFLTLYLQNTLGVSPLRAGIYFLPFALSIIAVAGAVPRVVERVGPKPLVLTGALLSAGGLWWLSKLSISSTYLGGLLGPMLLVAGGLALSFVPLTLLAVAGVEPDREGIASALPNSAQQVGGSLGLAVLGTIAIEATRQRLLALGPAASRLLHAQPPPRGGPVPSVIRRLVDGAYVHGYQTALEVSAGMLLVALLLAALGLRTSPVPPSGTPTRQDPRADSGDDQTPVAGRAAGSLRVLTELDLRGRT